MLRAAAPSLGSLIRAEGAAPGAISARPARPPGLAAGRRRDGAGGADVGNEGGRELAEPGDPSHVL